MRAILWSRQPEEYSRILAKAQEAAYLALDRMVHDLRNRDDQAPDELAKMAAVAARVTRDFVSVLDTIRQSINEDEILGKLVEQMHALEKTHQEMLHGKPVETQWKTTNSLGEPADETGERSRDGGDLHDSERTPALDDLGGGTGE